MGALTNGTNNSNNYNILHYRLPRCIPNNEILHKKTNGFGQKVIETFI